MYRLLIALAMLVLASIACDGADAWKCKRSACNTWDTCYCAEK